jgi:hypothetical protein
MVYLKVLITAPHEQSYKIYYVNFNVIVYFLYDILNVIPQVLPFRLTLCAMLFSVHLEDYNEDEKERPGEIGYQFMSAWGKGTV